MKFAARGAKKSRLLASGPRPSIMKPMHLAIHLNAKRQVRSLNKAKAVKHAAIQHSLGAGHQSVQHHYTRKSR